jgi:hypothetical protein
MGFAYLQDAFNFLETLDDTHVAGLVVDLALHDSRINRWVKDGAVKV